MRSLVARSREVVWGVKLACPASQVLQVMGKEPGQGARPPQTIQTSQDARCFGQLSLPEGRTGPDGAVNG